MVMLDECVVVRFDLLFHAVLFLLREFAVHLRSVFYHMHVGFDDLRLALQDDVKQLTVITLVEEELTTLDINQLDEARQRLIGILIIF